MTWADKQSTRLPDTASTLQSNTFQSLQVLKTCWTYLFKPRDRSRMATAEGPARAHGEFSGDRPALGKTRLTS